MLNWRNQHSFLLCLITSICVTACNTKSAAKPDIYFTDVSSGSGIHYQHIDGAFITDDNSASRYMPETMGSGVVLFDFDLDDDLDIFVNNSSGFGPNRSVSNKGKPGLYENIGGFKFKDISAAAGFLPGRHGMGAVSADYNADGLPDLLLTGLGGPWLYKNLGNKSFQDVSATSGIKPLQWQDRNDNIGYLWSTAALFFDADGDGDIDLFVSNYVKWSPHADIFTTFDAVNKGYTSPRSYEGTVPLLYLQESGKFNLQMQFANSFKALAGKSLGAALWDFNGDNRLDIVVANDTHRNFYFQNTGTGTFDEKALELGIAFDRDGNARAGMGIDIADHFNNGISGVAIGNFQDEPTSLFEYQGGLFSESSDKTQVSHSSISKLTFGLQFADLDLDGWQDLIMANGHTEPMIQQVQPQAEYMQAITLLKNTGQGKFIDWSDLSGPAVQKKIVGRGLAIGDLDNDGDLDVVITENGGGLRLLRNDSPGQNYVRIRLRTIEYANRDAIGAKLVLKSDDGLVQRRMVRTGGSYLSQSEMTQTFGLGKRLEPGRLSIRWPDGTLSDYKLDSLNKTYTLFQPR